jgi:hypothetical protein
MRQPWFFILTMLGIGLVGFSIFVIAVVPTPNRESCDRLFAQFMASKDPVIVNRNGWLLYELDCNVSRRYWKLRQ